MKEGYRLEQKISTVCSDSLPFQCCHLDTWSHRGNCSEHRDPENIHTHAHFCNLQANFSRCRLKIFDSESVSYCSLLFVCSEFDLTLSLPMLTMVTLLSMTSQRWGRMGRMEGGYRSPSIIWMIPLDATMLVLARWTPFSPNRISPWRGRRGATSVNVKLLYKWNYERFCEEPLRDTYTVWHSDGDNLIGHRLNLREGSQVVDCQLQTENIIIN